LTNGQILRKKEIGKLIAKKSRREIMDETLKMEMVL
jgi:hypothetical protein